MGLKGSLTKSSIPEVVLDTGTIHKGFLHGIAEKGGEIIFKGFPFKIIFLPSGDFSSYQLVACGSKPSRHEFFNIQSPKKEVKTPVKPKVIGEVEL